MENLKTCKYCQSEISKKARICPNCRKKQGGKGKFIILGIIVFFILVNAINGGNDKSTGTENDTSSIEANTSSKVDDEATNKVEDDAANEVEDDTAKVDDIIAFGTEGQSKDLLLKVNEVGDKNEIKENQFLSYTPDSGKYAIINITIKNTGKEAVTLSNGYFKLLTTDGAEYNPTLLIGLDNKYISFESINPGLEVTGNLVFEIPKDITVTDMTLKFSGTSLFTSAINFSLK